MVARTVIAAIINDCDLSPSVLFPYFVVCYANTSSLSPTTSTPWLKIPNLALSIRRSSNLSRRYYVARLKDKRR